MSEQIAEFHLLTAFNEIKSFSAKQGKYINIGDFTSAVLKYDPASLREQMSDRSSKKGAALFNSTVEVLFRNICETVSPEVQADIEKYNHLSS